MSSFFCSRSYLPAAAIAGLLVFTGCSKFDESPASGGATVVSAGAYGAAGLDYVPNQVLIKFRPGVANEAKAAILGSINGKADEAFSAKGEQQSALSDELILAHTPLEVGEALGRLKNRAVVYAEPNFIYTAQGTPLVSDPYYVDPDGGTNKLSGEWGMYSATSTPANAYGSGAADLWARNATGSAGVAVGIVDTGVQYDHPDLTGQVGVPTEVNGQTGVDDNGNGKVDDKYGWNFLSNTNNVYDKGFKTNADDHGTHIAGIIGAIPNNGGVVGMNWNTDLIVAQFLGDRGGTTDNAVKAINYLTDLKRRGVNIVAINCSWGSTKSSQALSDAIRDAGTAGILIIAAAGTQSSPVNIDVTPFYPASYTWDNIISVAAINQNGTLAINSNYGPNSVDLAAPGARIWTTNPINSWYSYSSTSMATAFVSGAAALYAAAHPLATAADIKAAILAGAVATPQTSLSAWSVTGGRLNVSGF